VKSLSARGVISKRLLVNLRADADAVTRFLPEEFTPLTVNGSAIVGCCAIELRDMRPSAVPLPIGAHTVNVAHRVAVEHAGRPGMWIPRRVSSSRISQLVGGRAFPGVHSAAAIDFGDEPDVELRVSNSNGFDVALTTTPITTWPPGSVFGDAEEATDFYRAASHGWSPRRRADQMDVVRLDAGTWTVEAHALTSLTTEFWSTALPRDAWEPDVSLVVRDLPHTWRSVA